MASEREEALKKAEKLLRQGKLDLAIAEYVRMVEEQPRDWNIRNTLGDLYIRASQPDKAVASYMVIADHLMQEGFYPKAAAIYKKILKIRPDDEAVQLNVAEISARQGLLADARNYFVAVANKRRARGDRPGADKIVIRLGTLDPSDFDARGLGARTLAQSGDPAAAAQQYRTMHADLIEKGRLPEAMAALREAVAHNREDVDGRMELARAAVAAGDLEAAKTYLDRQTAGDDPALLMALMETELRSGAMDGARELLTRLLRRDQTLRARVVDLAWTLAPSSPEAAFVCIDTAVDTELAAGNFMDAAALLQEFVTRVSGQIGALLKLVEICVDGGLEATMYEAQAVLADAYLESGQASEARVIAEDLVAREPWEHAHIDRFRRALVMLNVPDPDALIAERLSGQGPFIATDPFMPAESFGSIDDVSSPAPGLQSDPGPEIQAEPGVTSASSDSGGAAIEALGAARAGTEEIVPDAMALPAPGFPPASEFGLDPTPGVAGRPAANEPDIPLRPRAVAPPAPPSLDATFQDFRTEVSKQTGTHEAGEQLTLARTYLEMGMAEEAIAALTEASRAPIFRFEAASTLGRLYEKQNDLVRAAEWLERASEAPAPSATEGREVLYDLGVILEKVGETARALAVCLELQADAGEYRDVAARIDRLSRVQTGG